MKIKDIINCLEIIAPPLLQETYDNAGLITGNTDWDCNGIIICLDATEAVVLEAIEKKCNCIVAHHPIIFSGLKKITGKNYVEKTIITAIKNDIVIYACHTNLDNVLHGVNGKIADTLGLINRQVLLPKNKLLKKLFVFVPVSYADNLRKVIFEVGGGNISNYSECSFNTEGIGTFKAEKNAQPFVGEKNLQHKENEIKIEVIFSAWLQNTILNAIILNHPYEEVAYDIVNLDNTSNLLGSGLIGDLPEAITETAFLQVLKNQFNLSVIKHTVLQNKMVKKIALCGGAGSFLIGAAIGCGADFYVTSDIKYHEFFDANNSLVLADIGHFESEQFTITLLFEVLKEKFPTFAVLKTGVLTNPVKYFF